MTGKLTIKQEKFCQKVIELGNQSEAYRAAFDCKRSTDKTIWESASKLMKDPKVAARIAELQKIHQKRHEVTVDSLTAELEEARALALKTEQTSAAVSASLGKAKLHGLLTEQLKVKHDYEEMTDDELLALARSKGITAGEAPAGGRDGEKKA